MRSPPSQGQSCHAYGACQLIPSVQMLSATESLVDDLKLCQGREPQEMMAGSADPVPGGPVTATAHPPTRVQELANFVNGGHVPATSGQASDITDPSTGEVYAQAPVSGPADVDAALKSAAAAQEGWRDATPAERSLALLRLADAIESRAEEIVAAECRNTGKPVTLTMA